ncbi:uncharacterized WD repeat-containing protein C17D11.16-like [Olea europaea var. sylvestris]|uniref:uncharacterized WD repeat-containing protein C17D11.16-like n=1 Tax=Olea europaea var. sylvestris TaxID=158386 RepID=UPI000C1D35C9|nr:uncharacterized WD repeat-containing protein C17D11.16-like [Olea europaea var. sylvestris]
MAHPTRNNHSSNGDGNCTSNSLQFNGIFSGGPPLRLSQIQLTLEEGRAPEEVDNLDEMDPRTIDCDPNSPGINPMINIYEFAELVDKALSCGLTTYVELFGSELGNLYYPSNDVDPYLKDNGHDDSDEEEDKTIKQDAVFVCARNEDVVGCLETSNKNATDGDSNMFCHHDINIPAFPLCTAWLDCPLKGGDKGNFVAVGTMDPAIEIWDLDIMGAVQPSFVLGGTIEKKRGKKKIIKYATGSHTDSVLELAWNKEYRNILASGSADKLAKIWDVTTRKCNLTMDHHTNKVQAVAWNRFAPQVLLTGSFDCSVVMKDSRIPSHSGFKWSVTAEVESLAWDPHTEHSFVVSLENGMVMGFDIRTASSDPKPSFTLHAHDKKVCTISYNSLVPNLLATGSIDKTVKLWDLTNNKPSCIASQNPKAGAVFSVSFSEDAPFLLAIGGSKKKLKMWDLLSDTGVAGRYGKYINELRRRPQS